MPKKTYKNIPSGIRDIADYAKKQGYIRFNPKDNIINFFLRKQGVVRRVKVCFDEEKFYDVDNKCYVNERNCGYILALKEYYYRLGIPTYWKKIDKKCECKRRYVLFIDVISELFNPKEWTIVKQCEIKENGVWKIVPHDVPTLDIDMSDEKRNNTIREMFSVYGVPVIALTQMFNLKERRIRKIVEDLREQHRKVKISRGLKKVPLERFEN